MSTETVTASWVANTESLPVNASHTVSIVQNAPVQRATNVAYVTIDSIGDNPDPIVHSSDAEMQRLVGVLGAYGIPVPVIVNTRLGRVLWGEEHVEAARLAGETEVLAVLVTLPDEDTHELARIALRQPYVRRNRAAITDKVRALAARGVDVSSPRTWG